MGNTNYSCDFIMDKIGKCGRLVYLSKSPLWSAGHLVLLSNITLDNLKYDNKYYKIKTTLV